MQTISINGKSYVAGLWWQVVDSVGQRNRKDVLTAARLSAEQQVQEGYNCVLVRKHQFGLGRVEAFQPFPALAASLRPKELPFVGIFRVDGNNIGAMWWVCAITKGGIIAGDGDVLYDDRETALQRVTSLLHVFGNIPISYDCLSMEESTIALVPLLHSDSKLERLYADPRQTKVRLAVVALIASVGIGYYAYDYYAVQKAAHAHKAQMLALQKAQQGKRSEAQKNIEQYFTKHWEKQPSVQGLADQCLPAVYAVPSVAQGWVLDASLCQANTIVLTWAHAQGASYTILPDKAILQASPTKATSTYPLAKQPPARGQLTHPLHTKAQITGNLYQVTQDVGAALRIQWFPPDSKEIEGLALEAPWVRADWELTSVPNGGLEELIALLDALPALTLESILLQKNTWILKGAVYATQ